MSFELDRIHIQLQNAINTDGYGPVTVDGQIIYNGETFNHLPTLRKYMGGECVKWVQTRLINNGYSCGSYGADGDFGSSTYNAVKAYQDSNNLTKDGIVGRNTWRTLLGI